MVFGELVMFLLVVGVVLISLLPILKINNEFKELNVLSTRVLKTEVELNLMLTNPFAIQWEKLKIEHDLLLEQFDIFKNQTELVEINDKVKTAMSAVLTLEQLFEKRWDNLGKAIPPIMSDMERVIFESSTPLMRMYKTEMIVRFDDADEIMARIADFENLLTINDSTLSSAFNVIQDQDEIIQAEISGKIRQMVITVGLIFLLVVLLVLVISSRIASQLAGSIVSFENGVKELRDGNLEVVFDSRSQDEIGRFGENLNNFTADLSDSIKRIKDSSSSSLRMKDELQAAVGDSSTSSESITGAVGEIREGMVDLDSKVGESGEAVHIVKNKTDELMKMLVEQKGMIDESTSSIKEMIAFVGNVTGITEKKKTATAELVQTAADGGKKLEETTSSIQQITGNIDDIRATASIIQAVAAQTSLLAMNAAIEAAHAGKYGTGFAVVADEIRKLAETSGKSSKKISGVLKDVITSIEHAAASGDETKRAFAEIDQEVKGVAGALDEIASNMEELGSGGNHILEAMTVLQGYTADVRESGGAMSEASDRLADAFSLVERVTDAVLNGIGGISGSIDEIRNAVSVVSEISRRLSSESEKLDSEVAAYHIAEDETSGEAESLPAEVIDEAAD